MKGREIAINLPTNLNSGRKTLRRLVPFAATAAVERKQWKGKNKDLAPSTPSTDNI